MTAKITVNGVRYDSVDAMPPQVRLAYEQALANMPPIADGGVMNIVEGEAPLVKYGLAIRNQIVINGTSYDDESAMPPDARELFQQAMREAGKARPADRKSNFTMSFQVNGPGFRFGNHPAAPAGSPAHQGPARAAAASRLTAGSPAPGPIEPAAPVGSLGVVIALVVSAVGALALWFLTRPR